MELSIKNKSNLNKFKQFLTDNDIELFDFEMRISYKRLCNLSSEYKKQQKLTKLNLQKGGSKNISQKLKKMQRQHILHLISSLVSKNDTKTNWILNLY
jgi:hypothetical protein